MKLIAMMYGDNDPQDFDAPEPEPIEVEFTGVSHYTICPEFFVVVKANGEHFAIRLYKIESFKLIND